jgi:CheY-like chemotaxis protein
VIEDHADSLAMMAKLLSRLVTDVLTAQTCAAARAIAASAQRPPHVVVGDIGLPDGDGVDLLRELKLNYNCGLIALTGHGADGDVERCKAAGVDFHLLKPVGVKELREAVWSFLENDRA